MPRAPSISWASAPTIPNSTSLRIAPPAVVDEVGLVYQLDGDGKDDMTWHHHASVVLRLLQREAGGGRAGPERGRGDRPGGPRAGQRRPQRPHPDRRPDHP